MAIHGKREEDLNDLLTELNTMLEKYSTEPQIWGLYAQMLVSLGKLEKAQAIYSYCLLPQLYIQALFII